MENPCDELELQLKIFLDQKDEDYEEFALRFDNIKMSFEDVGMVFELLRSKCDNTAAAPLLLSILQHLLCVRDDHYVRPAYFKLVDECVSQIVLHRSGCDPDFSYTRRFEMDVEPLIEHLVDRAKAEDGNSSGASQSVDGNDRVIIGKLYIQSYNCSARTELGSCHYREAGASSPIGDGLQENRSA